MALINCPECGKEISDQAVSCPNCGCPINEPQYDEEEEQKLTESALGIASLCLTVVCWLILLTNANLFNYIPIHSLYIVSAILSIISMVDKNHNSKCGTISMFFLIPFIIFLLF